MKSKKMTHFGRFIRHASVILLLFGTLNFLFLETQHAFAQTGAPPPPTDPVILPPAGSLIIDAIFPAIPPANITPLVGNGVLAVIPQNADNAIAIVNVTLCEKQNIDATLLVPASEQTDLVAKIEVIETGGLPAAALPVAFTNPLKVFEITVFNAQTGELITTHERILEFGVSLTPGVHPEDVALLHFNALEDEYGVIDITGDPIKGIVKAEMNETSTVEGIEQTEINRYTPFTLVSTTVSPQLAEAENEGTSSEGELIVQATPTLSKPDTTPSAQEVGTQADDGTASGSLFGSTTDDNDNSQSLFGAPAENDSEPDSDSEDTSESTSNESASVAGAYDSNNSNNNPLLSGFAVLITSLGAGFGFLRWRS